METNGCTVCMYCSGWTVMCWIHSLELADKLTIADGTPQEFELQCTVFLFQLHSQLHVQIFLTVVIKVGH